MINPEREQKQNVNINDKDLKDMDLEKNQNLFPFQLGKLEDLNRKLKEKVIKTISNSDLGHFNKVWDDYTKKSNHAQFFCELFLYYSLLKKGLKNIDFSFKHEGAEKDIYFEYNQKKVNIECTSPEPHYQEKDFSKEKLRNNEFFYFIPRELKDKHNKDYDLSKKFIQDADYKIFFVLPLHTLYDKRDIRFDKYEGKPYEGIWKNNEPVTLEKQWKTDGFNFIFLLRTNHNHNGSIDLIPELFTNLQKDDIIKTLIFDSVNNIISEFFDLKCCEESYVEDELKR